VFFLIFFLFSSADLHIFVVSVGRYAQMKENYERKVQDLHKVKMLNSQLLSTAGTSRILSHNTTCVADPDPVGLFGLMLFSLLVTAPDSILTCLKSSIFMKLIHLYMRLLIGVSCASLHPT
jgi:hypothetical protein